MTNSVYCNPTEVIHLDMGKLIAATTCIELLRKYKVNFTKVLDLMVKVGMKLKLTRTNCQVKQHAVNYIFSDGDIDLGITRIEDGNKIACYLSAEPVC